MKPEINWVICICKGYLTYLANSITFSLNLNSRQLAVQVIHDLIMQHTIELLEGHEIFFSLKDRKQTLYWTSWYTLHNLVMRYWLIIIYSHTHPNNVLSPEVLILELITPWNILHFRFWKGESWVRQSHGCGSCMGEHNRGDARELSTFSYFHFYQLVIQS